MKQDKLANALLLRKEYTAKLDQLKAIKQDSLYTLKVNRIQVTDNIEDLTMQVPMLTISQVTHAYDWYAKALREVDAMIQQTNWTVVVELPSYIQKGYEPLVIDRKDVKIQ